MRIHIATVLVLCLGFFLAPKTRYACGAMIPKAVSTASSKDQCKKAEKKDCCKANSGKKNGHHDCSGKCKHNSCRCSTSCSTVSLALANDTDTKNHVVIADKQKIGFKQSHYSSGVDSIWLPPKIA